jgi:hypothetical protein
MVTANMKMLCQEIGLGNRLWVLLSSAVYSY